MMLAFRYNSCCLSILHVSSVCLQELFVTLWLKHERRSFFFLSTLHHSVPYLLSEAAPVRQNVRALGLMHWTWFGGDPRLWINSASRDKIFRWVRPCTFKPLLDVDCLYLFLFSWVMVFACCFKQNWALFVIVQGNWIVVILIWCMRYGEINSAWLRIGSILRKEVSTFMFQKWLDFTVLLRMWRSLLVHWLTPRGHLMWIILDDWPWL